MTPTRPTSRLRALFALVLAFAAFAASLLVAPGLALALGSAKVEQAKVKEEDGRWKLKMTIDLGKPPDIPHVPMIFSFTPTMLYERNLTDESPEKPVIIKKPLQNQPSINESMDVGFSNVTGESFKLTKFNFMLRRDRGIEAGEYTLEIKRVSDGASIGGKIKLILDGDNPIIDRRAISFVGDSGKKKKPEEKKPEPAGDKPAGDPPAGATTSKEESDAALGLDPVAPPPDPNAPPAEKPKQGGCGCEVPGERPAGRPQLALLALVLPAALAMRRRRSVSRRSDRSGSRP